MKLSLVPELNTDAIKKSLPELPWNKRERLAKLGLKVEDAEVFVRYKNWAVYFDAMSHLLATDVKKVLLAVNYLTSDLAGLIKNDKNVFFENIDISTKISAKDFAKLVTMANDGVISSRATKDILKVMYEKGGEPEELADKLGLIQKSDEGELKAIAQKIVDDNPNVVAEYKSGKTSVVQFFVGQGMKATKGSGNPAVLKTIFEKLLS